MTENLDAINAYNWANNINQDPGFKISNQAFDYIYSQIKSEPDDLDGLRVSVKKAGCSGYEYELEFASKANKNNEFDFEFNYKFNSKDLMILIDKEIYTKFLKGGTILYYKQDGFNEGLEFKNPNVAHQCGCGDSFTLEEK